MCYRTKIAPAEAETITPHRTIETITVGRATPSGDISLRVKRER